jgi:transcriptional regulator with XRE-family HTH domain
MVGAKIKQIRESKGISQQFVIKKLGKSPGWLSNIEAGARGIKLEDLRDLAEVLEVPVATFFEVDDG